MIKNAEVHTSPRQRIAIIIVAFVMLFSTFAVYVGVVLSAGRNDTASTPKLSPEEEQRYQELVASYQAEYAKTVDEYSAAHFEEFKSYKSQVKPFNNAEITEIKTRDLKLGDGVEITEGNKNYSAFYIGWRTDDKEGEVVFDSSFDNYAEPTRLKEPIAGDAGLIEGWERGVVGMKIGGVREITIPSGYAYKDQANGDIPANSNLRFIIMAVPKLDVPISEELQNLVIKSSGGAY